MIHPGYQLPPFTNKTVFSKNAHNLRNRVLNALLRIPGLKITDENAAIDGLGGSNQVASVSASVSLYIIISIHDDYLTCHTWDGTTEGGDDIYVAKPTWLRFSIASSPTTIGTVDYSAYDTSTQSRLADNGTDTETQYTEPLYVKRGDGFDDLALIYAVTAYTGVAVSGDPVTLLDFNVDARKWIAAV